MFIKISKLRAIAIPGSTVSPSPLNLEENFKIEYQLRHSQNSDECILLNDLVGKRISLRWTGSIFCTRCDAQMNKSFAQGYCYSCFMTLAECDQCITRPELCHYHLGTCRQPDWGKEHCMIKHTVYLANTSHLKVGVTRNHQQLTRWMDQGATQSIVLGYTQTRRGAGRVESLLKKTVSDQTSWQKMLKGDSPEIDLLSSRMEIVAQLPLGLDFAPELHPKVFKFQYPVLAYPVNVKALSLEKTPHINSILQGIKGQYLITDEGVLNMRKHIGFEIEL